MRRRGIRMLVVTSGFLYLVAAANDRLALYVLAWMTMSLLVVCYALARFGAHGLEVRRRALPDRLVVGQPLSLGFDVRNLGSIPKSGLMLHDRHANAALRVHAERSVLVPLLSGESEVAVEAEAPPAVRGRTVLGPVQVTVGDPLGLFEVTRDLVDTRQEVLVHPRVEPLAAHLALGRTGLDDGRRGTAASGLVLHSLREYQPGDDLRHVHWLASARTGRLMTKEYERPSAAEGVVLLDLDARQVFGAGPGSSLEAAVSSAASVMAWLSEQGRPARLAAHEEQALDFATYGGRGLNRDLLDALALMRGDGAVSMPALLSQQADRVGPGAALVVISAGADATLLADLRRLGELGRGVWLILPDARAYAAADAKPVPDSLLTPQAVRARLAGSGVALSVLQPGASLTAVLDPREVAA
ncbi:MAG: DUF58 domain-containing protein [Armatimonadetes bacterium]|nr:DUF58 domain-containing protein [Armatimonadota bacterium]